MVVVNFKNENGNVAVKVRNDMRKQVMDKIINVLVDSGSFDGTMVNANGGLSIPIAVDRASGETVYANIELTVSTKDPNVKTEKKKKSKAAVAEEVPVLFD